MTRNLPQKSKSAFLISLILLFISVNSIAQKQINSNKSKGSITDEVDLISITNPIDSTITGEMIPVKVIAKNTGNDTLYDIPLKYYIDTLLIDNQSFNFSNGLLPDSTIELEFTNKYMSPNHNYTLSVAIEDTVTLVYNSDSISVDIISKAAQYDVKVIGMEINPSWGDTTCLPYNIYVTLKIVNVGTEPIYDMTMKYSINTTLKGNESWQDTLLVNDTLNYTFNTFYYCPIGYYLITGDVILNNEQYISDNVYYRNLLGINCGPSPSIKDVSNQKGNFKIYPNPTESIVNVDLSNFTSNKELKISVLDLNLRELEVYSIEPNITLQKLDLQSYSKGMYFIKLQRGSEILGVEKLIKH